MFLHVCRALAVCSVITGFFAAVLTLVGMKCTKIGGSEIANARVTFAGAITYVVSGETCLRRRGTLLNRVCVCVCEHC